MGFCFAAEFVSHFFSTLFPAGGVLIPFCGGVRKRVSRWGFFFLDFVAKYILVKLHPFKVRWFQKGVAIYKRDELIQIWKGSGWLRL